MKEKQIVFKLGESKAWALTEILSKFKTKNADLESSRDKLYDTIMQARMNPHEAVTKEEKEIVDAFLNGDFTSEMEEDLKMILCKLI